MYLRHTTIRKDGKVHRYWRLVRSVRVGRRVIQQTVAQLGELDEQGRVQARALAHRLIGTPERAQLFDDGSEQLTVPVRLKGIRIERPRQFGDVYLALALWRGTGLEALCERLLPIGKERIAWSKMAAVLVAARFCEPSSELHIAEDWYRRTALSDLLQLGDEEVNKDRLYRGLDHLLAYKTELEAHLSQRCGELFAIQNEVLLYDVTSTYFEGQAEANPQARRGYSRDHRPDCKQVCIALVVTFDGFPLGYEVFAGNTHDSRTLQTIVATMEARHGMLGRVWITDRGTVVLVDSFPPSCRDQSCHPRSRTIRPCLRRLLLLLPNPSSAQRLALTDRCDWIPCHRICRDGGMALPARSSHVERRQLAAVVARNALHAAFLILTCRNRSSRP